MTMSSREKMLSLIVGGTVVVLLNLLLVNAFAHRNTALRQELAERKTEWTAMQALLEQEQEWSQKDGALTGKQPKLTNENAAGVELLNVVSGLAKEHGVLIDNQVFGGVAKSAAYKSVPVSLDTHSTWPALIQFLYALQKPDQFIVCEAANIQVDPGDPTKMLGHFKIARWYAP